MGAYSNKEESPQVNNNLNNINPQLADNKLDINNYASVEKSKPANDEQSQMKQSLKVLYKNNFVSLTFVNI